MSKRPARSNRRDPDRTREAILVAAQDEFAAKGLAGGRVNVIARKSGANKRMIYHYFGSKDGLYLAALERVYEGLRGEERIKRCLIDIPPAADLFTGNARVTCKTRDVIRMEAHPKPGISCRYVRSYVSGCRHAGINTDLAISLLAIPRLVL